MMHDIAVRCGNGTRAAGLGLSKVDHGKDHSLWFGEESSLSARTGASRVVGSRVGGTCTPLGTGRASWVCSHVGGTCSRLQSRAGRAASIGGATANEPQSRGKELVVQVQAAAEVPHVSPALMAGTDKEDVDDPEDCLRKSSQ